MSIGLSAIGFSYVAQGRAVRIRKRVHSAVAGILIRIRKCLFADAVIIRIIIRKGGDIYL